ncbi:hypothetical protein E2C01_060488 [Portunus trituberculatus]|uniref:Uncharacterized protein n=1 Tax=Portunus trituberculatus TaxID=210409 RepID=A0A5B7H2M9_PORTR|nr:hypothetical protein [Portunus trituberculatus]
MVRKGVWCRGTRGHSPRAVAAWIATCFFLGRPAPRKTPPGPLSPPRRGRVRGPSREAKPEVSCYGLNLGDT